MEEKKRVLTGVLLLAAFVGLLGWYFLASYLSHREFREDQEKMLTVHDDLFAIDGLHDGNKVAVGKFGLILLSKDGGKSWQRRPSDTANALSAISFADNEHGFVGGSGGMLLATNDGGNSWRSQISGTKDQLLGVYAVTPTEIFAVGAFGTLLSTSNAGQSWTKHELNWDVLIGRIVKETGYVEPNLNAVYFTSPNVGWIVGEFGLVLNTNDGGKSWNSQRYGSDLPQLYAVKFLDDHHGWAMGQAGSLIQTTDGGKHWSSVEIATKRDLYNTSLDGQRGIIVGDGVALASSDGGSSWRPMSLKNEGQWLSGVMLKSSEAIAVGQGGTTQLLTLDNSASQSGTETK
jgi:photosystem II stability/assembly factor-like uncharacterized protein